MRRALAISQRLSDFPHGICETLCLIRHSSFRRGRRSLQLPGRLSPAAAGHWSRRCRRVPRPAIATHRARRVQRTGPRAAASGWLTVGKAGERKASAAPARRARSRSAGPWAELVIRPATTTYPHGPRPTRPVACAQMHTRAERRRQPGIAGHHQGQTPRPADPREVAPERLASGSPSWRSTTPARPRGRRATAGRGSGSRRASVNSQRSGSRPRRAGPRQPHVPRRAGAYPSCAAAAGMC